MAATHDAATPDDATRAQDRYRRLVLESPVPQVVAGSDGSIVEVNPAFAALIGRRVDELEGRAPIEFVHPDDAPALLERMARLLAGDVSRFDTEHRFVREDGVAVWVSGSVQRISEPDGGLAAAHAVLQDVTARRAALEQVRDSEERMRIVFDTLNEGVVVHDLEGIVSFNRAALDITGVDEDSIRQQRAWRLGDPIDVDGRPLGPEDRPTVRALRTGVAVRDQVIGFLHPERGRRWLLTAATPIRSETGWAGAVLSFSDITERKAAQDALTESEVRHRAVIEALHDGVVIHDGNRIVTANEAAAHILGVSREALLRTTGVLTQPLVERGGALVPPEQRPAYRTLTTGEPCRDVVVGIPTPRGVRWCVVNTVPLDLYGGARPPAVAVSFADATERLEAEDALRRSEERYRRLVESAPLGYLVTDDHGAIVEVNRFVEEMFAVPAEQVLGTRVHDWVHPDDVAEMDRHIAELWEGLTDRYEMELRLRHPTGALRWVASATTVANAPSPDRPGEELAYLVLLTDITDRKRAEEQRVQLERQLAHEATHDSLTGLPNRAHLLDLLDRTLHDLSTSRRRDAAATQVALLFLDLDRFKQVNDTLGHEAGDALLTEVARRIEAVLRPGDLVARLGGDEFVLVCPGVTGESHGRALAQRVVDAVESAPVSIGSAEISITASVGIALSRDDGHPEALLRDADAAMYRAKELGRARLEVFDDAMRESTARRIALADELSAALERGEIVVHYQPTVDLRSGAVRAVEALARWQHPTQGLLPPSEFIGLAEETGLIVGLGLRVLTAACVEARRWRDRLGDAAPLVHVNLSARQLGTPNLPRLVQGVLAGAGLPADRLCLEVTESVLMDDAEDSIAMLHQLDELGVRLAIDDFGTGYSSLSYLRRFPVSVLKVDRSFVDGLGPDPEDSAIVAAVVNLAHTLDLRAIAEGVETEEQLEGLRALGCDAAQGFLFSPPVPADELDDLLQRRWS